MKIIWKEAKSSPKIYHGYVGLWICFTALRNGATTNCPERAYVMSCYLPGIKDLVYGMHPDECKTRAEEILKDWLKGLNV